MASNAETCANVAISSQNWFVTTELNFDPADNCTKPPDTIPPVYSVTAKPMYACSTTVPAAANKPSAESWDSSCEVNDGKVQLRYNFYSDTNCKTLESYDLDTQMPTTYQYCNKHADQRHGNVTINRWTNNYCIYDGNYQKYNAGGDIIIDVRYRDGLCQGDVLQYTSLPLDTCKHLNSTSSTNLLQTLYVGFYSRYLYQSTDCSGTGVQLDDPQIAACYQYNQPVCSTNGQLQLYDYYNYDSAYYGPPASNLDTISSSTLIIGLGVGLGIPLLLGCLIAYHICIVRRRKPAQGPLLPEGANSSASLNKI
jgi:hypothetical protein